MACTSAPATAIKCMMAVSFVLAVLASSGAVGRLVPPELSMAEMHERWMAEHGRAYKDAAEKEHRFNIFSANVQYIESFNAEGEKHKYKLGINQFTDLTDEEFRTKYIGRSHPTTPSTAIVTNATTSAFTNANLELPPTWDWRDAEAVTPVKNQLLCSCCRAFPVIGAIEGIVKIKTGDLISLSEQELMECSPQDGCKGGDEALAYEYVVNNGIASEEDYPYTQLIGDCTSSNHQRVATITGYNTVDAFNETALLEAVASQPVSAAVEASGLAFRAYSSGIFTGECGSEPNQGVTIVGYGTADDGTKYWIIKNSWGTNWGEGGYMRLLRDVSKPEGLCGITKQVIYPIIELIL